MSEGLASRSHGDLRARWVVALGFHLLIQLLGFAIFTPLAAWIGRRLVVTRSSGGLMAPLSQTSASAL